MHRLRLPALFAAFAALLAPAATAQLSLQSFPDSGRLFARELPSNRATVALAGTVTEAGWDTIRAELRADGVVTQAESQPLSYALAGAPFALELTLTAGLIDYEVELFLEGGGQSQSAALAEALACGDVFLVAGQSNAYAGDAWKENRANDLQSRWIRSYGSTSLNPAQLEKFKQWFRADGENDSKRGAIGAWALALGSHLVKRAGVPVAVLNGAVGATPIHWHQRVDGNPLDLGTIYGRLLWRAEMAGIRTDVRAIFWYQGEANGGPSAANYGAQFDRLIADWHKDYPALEKVYFMQVRQGCGADEDSAIFEAQRQIAQRHPEVQLMSTTALPAHDGCHFYTTGYRTLAVHLTRLVARDFYNRAFGPEVAPPDVLSAQRANPLGDALLVELDAAAVGMTAEPGVAADFLLDDGAQVLSVQVQGSDLLLQLDRPTSSATLRYVGHSGDQGGMVYNRLGVGLLSFRVPLH